MALNLQPLLKSLLTNGNGKSKANGNRQPKRQRQVLRPRMRAATIPASVNTASRIRSTQTKQVQLFSNTDRLLHTTVPVDAARGSVIYDQVITPSIADRLRTQASLFQKIEYARLRFEVQTQTPTTNGGGYVVAFLHDPEMDVGTGEAALRALTAVQGTQTSKNWQSVDMTVQTTNQQYFTLNGDDVRFFSPGRFVVLTDGPPTSPISVTILFHWTVKLTRPALQRLVNRFPQAVLVGSALISNNANLRYINITAAGVIANPGASDDAGFIMENAFIGLPPLLAIGSNILWYQIPFCVTTQNGADSFIDTARFVSFRSGTVAGGTHYVGRLHYFPNDAQVVNGTRSSSILVQGDRLTPIIPDEFTGNITDVITLSYTSPSISDNQRPMVKRRFVQFAKQRYSPSSEVSSAPSMEDKMANLHLQRLPDVVPSYLLTNSTTS